MIKKITLLAFVCMIQFSLAQKVKKVDLDSYSFDVKYQELPEKNVPFEKRLYSTEINLGSIFAEYYTNKLILNQRLELFGWKRTKGFSNIDVVIDFNSFVQQPSKLETRVEEVKGKDGAVIKKNFYSVVAKIEATSSLKIVVKAAISESGKDEQILIPFNIEYTYKSNNENENQQVVNDLYAKQKAEFFKESINSYVEKVISDTSMKINSLYGFRPKFYKDNLWIIDSEEEEGAIQKEAIEAVKVIFSKMTAEDSIDNIRSEMQPLIEYFESLKTKYTEDDKSSKKIRYSAYYNLGKIYLHLDQPEKAVLEGEGLITNGYDKKDGIKIKESANFDLKKFKVLSLTTKHNPILY